MFLNQDGCYYIRRWLERLPDGSWPNKPVRLAIVETLIDLPISVENLQKSDLGKVIMQMSRAKDEDAEIRRHAS
jgi:hypothetical protein